jgi:lipopolysaccharide export LptBFGC system permease protein LptF
MVWLNESHRVGLRLHLWVFSSIARWLIGGVIALTSALIIGQLIKLHRWLWPLDQVRLEALSTLCLSGGITLMEASLPLIPLIALGVGYHALRYKRIDLVWLSVGRSPLGLLSPALYVGLICALSSGWVAQKLTPEALSKLHPVIERLMLHTWATEERIFEVKAPLIPTRLPRIFNHNQPISDKKMERQRMWLTLIEDRDQHVSAWGWIPSEQTVFQAQLSHVLSSSKEMLSVSLEDVYLWSPSLQLQLDTLIVQLPASRDFKLFNALKTFGPPNALFNTELDPDDPHHLFTWHKRTSLPSSALPWALLGALLGLWGRSSLSLCIGVGLVALSYSLLRALELHARFEGGAPIVAAWAPVILLYLISIGAVFIWWRRGGIWSATSRI